MGEDATLEVAQLGPGLDGELRDQRLTSAPVGVERLRLAARAIEREHQLSPEALAQRLGRDEAFELADELRSAPRGELRLDAVLHRVQAQAFEPSGLGLDERLESDVAQGLAAPEPECSTEPLGGAPGIATLERVTALGRQPLEALEVQLPGRRLQHVPRRARCDRVRPERLAQARDVPVQGGRSGGRRPFPPEQLDHPLAGDNTVRAEQQQRQDGALLAASQPNDAPVVAHLDRPKKAEFHRAFTATLQRRRPTRKASISRALAALSSPFAPTSTIGAWHARVS